MIEKENIFEIASLASFESMALKVFNQQYQQIESYRRFCDLIGRTPTEVSNVNQIPFLPIQFFKQHEILAPKNQAEVVFNSSGTTGSMLSKHHVTDISIYEKSFLKGFNLFYGHPSQYVILALLPSYLEQGNSSLVYMVDRLIKESAHLESGFYLNDLDTLGKTIKTLESKGQKTLLIGVSYALLDMIELKQFELKHTIIMETGGMKGRRKEMVKPELHQVLKKGFGVTEIHSEYGMTELLSQAYSQGGGRFLCPPWMRILTRDPEDALSLVVDKTGGINIIDLANLNSCAFIATEDLGKVNADGSFEILGRFDSSDIRGCNLMVL